MRGFAQIEQSPSMGFWVTVLLAVVVEIAVVVDVGMVILKSISGTLTRDTVTGHEEDVVRRLLDAGAIVDEVAPVAEDADGLISDVVSLVRSAILSVLADAELPSTEVLSGSTVLEALLEIAGLAEMVDSSRCVSLSATGTMAFSL